MKGHVQQYKKAAYSMGKDLHLPHIGKRTDLQNIQRTKKKNWLSKEQIIQLKMEYRPKQRTLNI